MTRDKFEKVTWELIGDYLGHEDEVSLLQHLVTFAVLICSVVVFT